MANRTSVILGTLGFTAALALAALSQEPQATQTKGYYCRHSEMEFFNRYFINEETGQDGFFVFEIDCLGTTIDVQGGKITETKPPTWRWLDEDGQSWTATIKEEQIFGIAYERASVILELPSGATQQFFSTSNVFYRKDDPSCVSRHGDAPFVTGFIEVEFPVSLRREVVELLMKNGWAAQIWDETKNEWVVDNALIFADESCQNGTCAVGVDTGPGMEFQAMTELHGLGPEVCANRIGDGAGAPPVHIAGLELHTLIPGGEYHPGGVQKQVEDLLVTKLFGQGVTSSELRQFGRGHSYVTTALGPGRALQLNHGTGYWYKADINISIGINTHSDNLGEVVELTVLDMFEIRAPEDLETLPEGLVRAGRRLEYLDSNGQPGRDFETLSVWSNLIANRAAEVLGGYVEGNF
ncbi:hypothetical protein HGO38_24455 [Rhizobium sp. CG5]|uniref:hypothetical protein n=1 Tax=Rhizobium sp. CG5 TaxID=2726076 RepID=UPI002033F78A|nr:hypothetical protein [Rhizobium sp. CG5]MCM2476602.1 hypothetical protein [Rhizobium sp. CG5]